LVQWPRGDVAETQMNISSFERLLGFIAVLCACLTSGFAGVFIQKMLTQSKTSIWMRNVQFGSFGLVAALCLALGKDGGRISEIGLTGGYTTRVWLVVGMNSFGGLICAVMLKYAGATLGCFSTAMSIILTCMTTLVIDPEDFQLDLLFCLGTGLAICSTLAYGLGYPSIVYTIFEKILGPNEQRV